MTMRFCVALVCGQILLGRTSCLTAAEPVATELFARKNLVAWCIVPFDSKKRRPEERAAMLENLGFSKFAYDYRAEHIPTFDAELESLKRHHVELTAWWFPTSLNDEAKMTLDLFRRHHVTPQLWVTGGGAPTKSDQEQQQRIRDEAARIRPIALEAAKIGCKVALYNHGGWFGEPENQIAIIQELKLPNVGIVYNQHHGHEHLDRFAELLQKMKPYLYTLNLNGMVQDGERKGRKILPLGQGDLDLGLLKIIRDSGYSGLIGILGHTQDDAEERLKDNLDGLDWLVPQLDGKAAGPKPKPRTPVPLAQAAAHSEQQRVSRLTEGRFGKAIDGRAGGALVAGRDEFRQFPITVECWTKLNDKAPYNILVAHELKSSGTHWELFSMAGTGTFTVYTPGFAPDHCNSNAMICDGKWHHVAMILESDRIRLLVDGQAVASQAHQRNVRPTVAGDIALATLVDQQIGCTGLVDEVRISRGVRSITSISEKTFTADDTTIALWHLDELVENKQYDDVTRLNHALVTNSSVVGSDGAKRSKIEGHWGEDALGFRWTEEDSRDDRFGQMDTGPFFSSSMTGPGGTVYKSIVVRVGDNRTASICYDTELLRASAGWNGFVRFDAARFGIIVPPRIEGDVTFTTPLLGGWTRTEEFSNFRETSKYGGLPKTEAHYEGLYRHGKRVVLKFAIGTGGLKSDEGNGLRTIVLESPWLEEANGITALSRTLLIEPSTTSISMLVSQAPSHVRLIADQGIATLKRGIEGCHVLVVPPHAKPVSLKLLIGAPNVDSAGFDKLAAGSPAAEDLANLIKPGPSVWGEPLVTAGEVSSIRAPLVTDTITLPFENPFHALMFCGGHDFLPDGRAYVCTLHGDVWLVDGIDETLKRITWRRFATGLFQPLGIKVMPKSSNDPSARDMDVYVVGRDQITRLHDQNGDGEADFYENFNNDAYVTLNGHEYVTSLETDRAGNFYFVKGNCDSATPHDGSLLRVSADGSKLEVFATGFRNSNGIGIGPNDEITVAPQEGEWTPASAVFDVHQGRFYGAMMSHHQTPPPTDFERPICWFPRLADNSCGGQVWVPHGQWGPLANQLLHLSYGQCELRLILRESFEREREKDSSSGIIARSQMSSINGGSTELPLTFASGIHRGRFNKKDGHLYLTGLKGWVTSAVNDGCFQRVRYTGQPIDLLVGMKTYRNGIALTFSRPLNPDDATNIDNYQIEAWNYLWSSAYGSPDLRSSAPGQVGRDEVEPRSVTLLEDRRTIFIELPDFKPVDQLGITFSLHSEDGAAVEQTAYLTINLVPSDSMPEEKLRRSKSDLARSELLARLSPGVLVTTPAWPIPVQSRMVAWTDFPSNGKRGELIATGYLKVPASGQCRINAITDCPAQLEINGQSYPFGDRDIGVSLRKGLVPFRVVQQVAQSKLSFRLMWESDRFPREAVPAASLFHEAAKVHNSAKQKLIAEGRVLYSDRKCAQCHQDKPEISALAGLPAQAEQRGRGPQLQGVGSRLTVEWLAAWLRDPKRLRPDATMPRIPELQNEDTLKDLVAYLVGLQDKDVAARAGIQGPTKDSGHQLSGSVGFEQFGCIACHGLTKEDEHPEWNRISLHFAGTKFRSGQLARYLMAPQKYHFGSRMPDFHLTETEAMALARQIESPSNGLIENLHEVNEGDRERGQRLFSELRCNHCHQAALTDKIIPPSLASVCTANPDDGCLADDANRSRKAPSFQFTDRQREALVAFLSARAKGSESSEAVHMNPLPQLLTSLRCTACHARDGSSALWPEIVAEEGSGKMPDIVPQLTWIGEKLRGPWIERLLKGEIKDKPRPWIKARMPAFPAYAEVIAHAMASEHGVPFDDPLSTHLNTDQIEMGRRLTLRDGGLDCRQCHGVGKELPRGDVNTQIALGINFLMIPQRLRPEFAMRQLLDPPRYDSSSRMPRFAADLRTTAAKQFENGDAKKQFAALQQYLWSLNGTE